MSNSIALEKYGVGDSSYQAAGKMEGLRRLCEDFYEVMSTIPEARHIRQMHVEDLSLMMDKLTLFLAMWLGGPRLYLEKYGKIGMPQAHQHLVINEPERDAWLLCMKIALERQSYESRFARYLYQQLCRPAEVIRWTSKSEC